MKNQRRDVLKSLLAMGAMCQLGASPALAGALGTASEQVAALQEANSEFDAKSFDFWSNFNNREASPIVLRPGQSRGNPSAGSNGLQPVFYHFGPEGFRNAAELDQSSLVSDGDVIVGVNTSILKICPHDVDTFKRLQNAQVRVDVAQKTSILPMVEAMAYTAVSGMLSAKPASSKKTRASTSTSSSGKSSGSSSSSPSSSSQKKAPSGSVQDISIQSDPTWQKMQSIYLKKGSGRWALNLEAQKKDSLFTKVMQTVIQYGGQFAPMIGLPGITMSALQSFNALYGAIHAEPVSIIQSNPLAVYATQEALQETGSPGVAGILLRSGTYVLVAANQAPTLDDLKNLTVMQGRIVPPKTPALELDAVAADTLPHATYVTFDVQVRSTRVISNGGTSKSG